jgi:hypothetical protein
MTVTVPPYAKPSHPPDNLPKRNKKMKFQAMNVRTIATLTLGFLTATVFLPAREIGFVEKFSLAEDRSKALEELVAGTQEYYYYSAFMP